MRVVWCLHCERVNRAVNKTGGCVTPGCTGSVMDISNYAHEEGGFFDQENGGFPVGWPEEPPPDGTWLPLYPPSQWQVGAVKFAAGRKTV